MSKNKKFISLFVFTVLAVGLGFAWSYSRPSLAGVPTPRAASINLAGSSTTVLQELSTSTDPVIKTVEIGESVDLARLNMAYNASGTVATIETSFEYSWDGTNFFAEVGGFNNNTTSVDTLMLNNATSSVIFVPGKASELQQQSFAFDTKGARYIRFKFSRAGTPTILPSNDMFWASLVPIDNR